MHILNFKLHREYYIFSTLADGMVIHLQHIGSCNEVQRKVETWAWKLWRCVQRVAGEFGKWEECVMGAQ